jgi:hypothetical protein
LPLPLTRAALFLTLTALAVRAATAADPGPSQPPGAPSATPPEKLVRQLDSDDYQVRNAAALQLNNLPGAALPVIERAAADPSISPESKVRLDVALKFLRPRAVREPRAIALRKFNEQMLHDAYRAGAKATGAAAAQDAATDKAVHAAIDLFVGLPLDASPMRDPQRTKAVAAFRKLVEAGSDDPLVRCLHYAAIGPAGPRLKPDAKADYDKARAEVLAGPYNPAVKMQVIAYGVRMRLGDRPTAAEEAIKVLPELVAAKDLPAGAAFEAMELVRQAHARIIGAYPPKAAAVADEWVRLRPDAAEPLIFKGRWMLYSGVEASGMDFSKADAPKLYGWAEQALQRAWELDPTDARSAELMIGVKNVQGSNGGPDTRAAMEQWFSRAIEADPDSVEAYNFKMGYLRPSQRGSVKEMIEFGHECAKTQNWRAGIPQFLADAHVIAAQWTRTRFDAYFKQPGAWEDIVTVYEGHLLNFPDDVYHRNQYLLMAFRAQRPDVGYRQSQILGDKAMFKVSSPTNPTTWTANDMGATAPARRQQ